VATEIWQLPVNGGLSVVLLFILPCGICTGNSCNSQWGESLRGQRSFD